MLKCSIGSLFIQNIIFIITLVGDKLLFLFHMKAWEQCSIFIPWANARFITESGTSDHMFHIALTHLQLIESSVLSPLVQLSFTFSLFALCFLYCSNYGTFCTHHPPPLVERCSSNFCSITLTMEHATNNIFANFCQTLPISTSCFCTHLRNE